MQTIEIYEFNELSAKAKKEAIQAHIHFLTNHYDMDNMDSSDEVIGHELQEFGYMFFTDGEMVPLGYYTI